MAKVEASADAGLPPAFAEYEEATGLTVINVPLPQEAFPEPLPTAVVESPATAPPPAAAAAAGDPTHFEPITLRARHDGWSPARQRQFLEELADCGLVNEAAARVGMTRQSAYQLRRRAEGTAFGFAWEAAVLSGMRRIHSIAFERAVEGVVKPVFYHGEKVGEQRVYDTRLLLGLVGRFGNAWSANRVRDVEKNWDSWLEAVEQGRPEPAPEMKRTLDGDGPVWMDEDGIWWTDFPPSAEDSDVEEHGEWGDEDYRRSLTRDEMESLEAAQSDRRARAAAERAAFFARDE
ncbi:MAG TPA: hypothetical protein VIT45_03960 [Allosphingosinicella sp.]